jgi:hypothetical protein
VTAGLALLFVAYTIELWLASRALDKRIAAVRTDVPVPVAVRAAAVPR